MTDFAIVLGTRPEIIKLAPVIRGCERLALDYHLIHTGQHYSESLDEVFFEQLELPTPDVNLGVGSGNHGEQTAEMLVGIEAELLDREPDVLVVQGDTNSTLAGTLAASKLSPDLAHVEAGLRSFDREMPEEINRVLADHASDYLFAPTETSADYLREEGRPEESIYVTGNTVVDAVAQNRELVAEKSDILDELGVAGDYAVLTAHRAENVDDRERFADLLEGVGRVAETLDLEVVYPVHPRAQERLDEFGLGVPARIQLVDPLDYLDFLRLEAEAELLLTDSGGIQEEGCILGVPCVTIRDSTERPETVDVGANVLAGVDPDAIVDAAMEMYGADGDWSNPYGDGDSAERILDVLATDYNW